MTTTRTHRAFGAASVVIFALACVAVMPANAASAKPAKPFDFNGDAQADVAVGVPLYDVSGRKDAGAIVTLPGGERAVSLKETVIAQASPGVPGVAQSGNEFGGAIASADFNRDGYADLAVGAIHDGTGSVTLLFGSAAGLGSSGAKRIDGAGHSQFGAALAAADFDKDGWPDLAVGSLRDGLDETVSFGSGAVVVLHGGSDGFGLNDAWTIPRPTQGMRDFGAVLAVGDVNRDGFPDVAEGWEGEHVFFDDTPFKGHTTLALGGPTGPRTAAVLGSHKASSLAVGDVTGDGYADVVVGTAIPGTFVEGEPPPAGLVTLYRGSTAGVRAGTSINQSSPGVPGAEETSRRYGSDQFGAAVALVDLNRDGRLDIVIGAPGEDRGAGRVTVVHGARRGFARTGNFAFDQASAGVAGTKERAGVRNHAFLPGDHFGAALSALDVVGSNRRDILIGSPAENGAPGTDIGAGSLTVLRTAGTRWSSSQAISLRMLGRRAGVGTVGSAGAFGSVIGRSR